MLGGFSGAPQGAENIGFHWIKPDLTDNSCRVQLKTSDKFNT